MPPSSRAECRGARTTHSPPRFARRSGATRRRRSRRRRSPNTSWTRWATGCEMPDDRHATLGEALDAIAGRQPDAPLMHRLGRPPVTHGALGEQLRDIRATLRDRGIGPGDVIAGFADSRATMAMACLALPASSTFAPLAPSLAAPAYE